jgi:hypothetical protein
MRLDLIQRWAQALPLDPTMHAFEVLTRLYTADELAEELARSILRTAQQANVCHVQLGQAVAKLLAQDALWPGETLASAPAAPDGSASATRLQP